MNGVGPGGRNVVDYQPPPTFIGFDSFSYPDFLDLRAGADPIDKLAGYEMQVRPRSGLAARHGVTLPNAPATIDSDRRRGG